MINKLHNQETKHQRFYADVYANFLAGRRTRSKVTLYKNFAQNRTISSANDQSGKEYPIFSLFADADHIIKNLYSLWLQEKLCDVELNIGNTSIKAHKIILAAYSGYIRDVLSLHENRHFNKVPLLGVKNHIVENVIHAFYSGSIALSSDTVDDTLSTATYLRVPLIVNACSRYLHDELSIENCVRTFQIANLYGLSNLYEQAALFISLHFPQVSKQKGFTKLRYCELLSLLPKDELKVDSEIEVFDVIVSWIEAEKISRMKYTDRLMRYVRFPFISEQDLIKRVLSCPLFTGFELVCENIQSAIYYHRFPQQRIQLPIPRGAVKMNCLVACGGLAKKADGAVTEKVFYCNLENGDWKHLTDLPEPRHHHAAATLGGYLYVAGGDSAYDSTCPSNKLWRYDPTTGDWIQLACMNNARESFQMSALDFKLYVVGGRIKGDEAIKTVESYNPSTNVWVNLMPISTPRRHVAIAAADGFLYAVGGSNKNIISRKTERYDPALNKWVRRAPTYKPRFSAALHLIKNCLFLLGGISAELFHPSCNMQEESEIEIYCPSSDQWSVLTLHPAFPATSLSHSYTPPFTDQRRHSYPITKRQSVFNRKATQSLHHKIEEPTAYRIEVPRTESASCCHEGKVFLIGGYSWNYRGRIDDTECIDIVSLVESKKVLEDAEKSTTKVQKYPLRCTGIASVSLTLRTTTPFEAIK